MPSPQRSRANGSWRVLSVMNASGARLDAMAPPRAVDVAVCRWNVDIGQIGTHVKIRTLGEDPRADDLHQALSGV